MSRKVGHGAVMSRGLETTRSAGFPTSRDRSHPALLTAGRKAAERGEKFRLGQYQIGVINPA